jgi:hypothetical protein
MSHTPGPWAVEPVGTADNGKTICEVVTSARGEMVASHMYYDDAQLIAAAPDLLVALESAVKFIDSEYPNSSVDKYWPAIAPIVAQGKAAIKKARG